ncbi:acetaldehyde dehydrogenase (acetylating) [Streptomyces sp. NPDC004096]|uniref:acetylating acetaldehyde dehydrogenase n=1 Tax=unclassified Streptomyces TaxID=2593676 RepID=UPI0033B508B1
MKRQGRPTVAVLGAGLIGVDLAAKIMRSDLLDCGLVAGRDQRTPGLRLAADLGIATSADGVRSVLEAETPFDIVFDATNAMAHAEHAELLGRSRILLVDLTPSRVGRMIVPSVNGTDLPEYGDVNMVSCGGQAAVPILHAITRLHRVDHVEVVTTAAGLSVGRSTRLNLDEYVDTTQEAVRTFTGVKGVKAILNVSPARPPATFRVAMTLIGDGLDAGSVRDAVDEAAADVQAFAAGFAVTACVVADGRAFVAVEVTSRGDRLPAYAGNLDIINSAAIQVAERHAAQAFTLAEEKTA